MKRLLVTVIIVLAVFSFSMNAVADYNFLSPECNIFLEELKEKYRAAEVVEVVREIISKEKEVCLIWRVIIPPNSGIERKKAVQENVYDEIGKWEGLYTFTDIVVINPKGWTRIVWESAAETYRYDIPRLCFVFDS